MESLSRATRNKIASAAHFRCEYCQTAQEISGAQMHVEHIIPLARGSHLDESNLCLACAWCNSYFRWSENGVYIIGLTAIGRATVDTLKMNNVFIVPARRHWVEAGWHPP